MIEKTPAQRIEEALAPFLESNLDLSATRMVLHEMFTSAVSNAPDDEIDNFTARRMTPHYLAIVMLLENLQSLQK
ncbi:MAG: hypothetical protein DCE86_05315 [Flavobacteriaceae bacterium]|nr:MAG: hypothetical protein DCE86_05315 [Flavobacteriaceae bacterium]